MSGAVGMLVSFHHNEKNIQDSKISKEEVYFYSLALRPMTAHSVMGPWMVEEACLSYSSWK